MRTKKPLRSFQLTGDVDTENSALQYKVLECSNTVETHYSIRKDSLEFTVTMKMLVYLYHYH